MLHTLSLETLRCQWAIYIAVFKAVVRKSFRENKLETVKQIAKTAKYRDNILGTCLALSISPVNLSWHLTTKFWFYVLFVYDISLCDFFRYPKTMEVNVQWMSHHMVFKELTPWCTQNTVLVTLDNLQTSSWKVFFGTTFYQTNSLSESCWQHVLGMIQCFWKKQTQNFTSTLFPSFFLYPTTMEVNSFLFVVLTESMRNVFFPQAMLNKHSGYFSEYTVNSCSRDYFFGKGPSLTTKWISENNAMNFFLVLF